MTGNFADLTHFDQFAAFTIGFFAVARFVRLIAFDSYPPSAWIRVKWDDLTHESQWNTLLHCAYCLAPYIAALNMLAAWASDFHWIWWVINLWLAMSYLASMVVAYDGDHD